jgi:hypothetical protein
MPEEWGRGKKGEESKKKGNIKGRTFLVILYSKHWGILRH